MNLNTARQLSNAVAARATPAVWVVRSTYVRGGDMKASAPMSFRMATVTARMVREGMGYATVERA